MNLTPDEIRKEATMNAPIDVVWSALSHPTKFGQWFGANLNGPFVAGQRMVATMQPTQMDAEVAKMQEPFAGQEFFLDVEVVDPPHRLAFRWAPWGNPNPNDPTTLVTFELESTGPNTTHLVITESGFSHIPLERRAKAFADNDGGWALQLRLIATFLARKMGA